MNRILHTGYKEVEYSYVFRSAYWGFSKAPWTESGWSRKLKQDQDMAVINMAKYWFSDDVFEKIILKNGWTSELEVRI